MTSQAEKAFKLGWKYPEKISNAGYKFKRPIKQEVLFTAEDLKDVIPERMNWLLKTAIHEWIYHKRNIEDIILYYIIKSMEG